MYNPIQPGIPRSFDRRVIYRQFLPSNDNIDVVYCFWLLHTPQELHDDFEYLVLPDGCIDIVFDVSSTPHFEGAVAMTPGITAERLKLGRSFSYIGIRLRPGVWRESVEGIVGGSVELDCLFQYDFRQAHRQMIYKSIGERLEILEEMIASLKSREIIASSQFTRVLSDSHLLEVSDLASALGYSRRHLQRLFVNAVGYMPHDYIKVIRFQQALRSRSIAAYADQSHYIREHKRITGMLPGAFRAIYC